MKTPAIDDPVLSLRMALRTSATRQPFAPALIHRESATVATVLVTPFATLTSQIDLVAKALLQVGIRANETVAIIGVSTPEYLFAFYAASDVAIAFPVNPLLSTEALTQQFRLANVSVCIVVGDPANAGLDARLAPALAASPQLRLIVTTDGEGSLLQTRDGIGRLGWNEFLHQTAEQSAPPTDRSLEAIVAYFHTGGTSGSPKLARLSRRALLAGARFAAEQIGYRADDRVLNLLPYFHVGGALATATGALLSGAANVTCGVMGARDPVLVQNLWSVITDLGVTVAGLVPTSWGAVASFPIPRMSEPFRAMATGSSSMPTGTRDQLVAAVGVPFCEVYGMTEFAGFCTGQPFDGALTEAGVGQPHPETELMLLEPLGEVALRGPSAFSGYLTDTGVIDDPGQGYVRTGDLGRLGQAGQLVLRGRIKDVIVRSGHNIDPASIEAVACGHPDVAQAAAVGQPDEYAGEVPVLYIVLKPGSGTPDIDSHMRDHGLEAPARPRAIRTLEALPLTVVGKLNRGRLRQLASIEAASNALAELGVVAAIQCHDPAARELTLAPEVALTPDAFAEVSDRLGRLGLSVITSPRPG